VADRLCERWESCQGIIGGASLAFLSYFLGQYFTVSPSTANQAVDSRIRDAAVLAGQTNDWKSFNQRFSSYPGQAKYYYFLHYGKKRCSDKNLNPKVSHATSASPARL
ncbi:MAG TPA: hypothetical protein VGC79_25015, partial [Polyangiaceae bacterium]